MLEIAIIIIVCVSILVPFFFNDYFVVFVVFILTKSEVQLRVHHLDFGSIPSSDF